MQEVLNDELSSKQYDAEETTKWSKEISDNIKDKLKSRFCIRAVNGGKYKVFFTKVFLLPDCLIIILLLKWLTQNNTGHQTTNGSYCSFH